jgi:hypothetical protein
MGGDRLTVIRGRFEPPLFGCFHRLLVQPEPCIERLHNLHVIANGAVGLHDYVHKYSALNSGISSFQRLDGFDGLHDRGGQEIPPSGKLLPPSNLY